MKRTKNFNKFCYVWPLSVAFICMFRLSIVRFYFFGCCRYFNVCRQENSSGSFGTHVSYCSWECSNQRAEKIEDWNRFKRQNGHRRWSFAFIVVSVVQCTCTSLRTFNRVHHFTVAVVVVVPFYLPRFYSFPVFFFFFFISLHHSFQCLRQNAEIPFQMQIL